MSNPVRDHYSRIRFRLAASCILATAQFGTPAAGQVAEADQYLPGSYEQAEPYAGEIYLYSDAELEELVGPVALYPDDLLAIVLPASTYPLQLVEAARFLERVGHDRSLEPEEHWDDSVFALLNYPEVVELLNEDLDRTWQLGEAVLNQRPDVLAAIERFRERAYAAGNLHSDEHQVVHVIDEYIEIEPADPQVIYVPYYEPARVIVYQPVQVYRYYPRPYPVYYYPYPAGHWFRSRYFWGVTSWFSIGWSTLHLHVHHHGHAAHPFYGHHFYTPYYRSRHAHVRRGHEREEDHRWVPGPRHGARPAQREGPRSRYSTSTSTARAGPVTTTASVRQPPSDGRRDSDQRELRTERPNADERRPRVDRVEPDTRHGLTTRQPQSPAEGERVRPATRPHAPERTAEERVQRVPRDAQDTSRGRERDPHSRAGYTPRPVDARERSRQPASPSRDRSSRAPDRLAERTTELRPERAPARTDRPASEREADRPERNSGRQAEPTSRARASGSEHSPDRSEDSAEQPTRTRQVARGDSRRAGRERH